MGQMNEVHPLEIVVHHELQRVRHMAFMGLDLEAHDRAILQQIAGPFDQPRMVKKELQEGVGARVIAVERHARDLLHFVDVLLLGRRQAHTQI
jgi:hypothetical protein